MDQEMNSGYVSKFYKTPWVMRKGHPQPQSIGSRWSISPAQQKNPTDLCSIQTSVLVSMNGIPGNENQLLVVADLFFNILDGSNSLVNSF